MVNAEANRILDNVCHRFHRRVTRSHVLTYEVLHMGNFFRNFILLTYQLGLVTIAIDGLTFFKLVDKQNSMYIPKIWTL